MFAHQGCIGWGEFLSFIKKLQLGIEEDSDSCL